MSSVNVKGSQMNDICGQAELGGGVHPTGLEKRTVLSLHFKKMHE